MTRYEYLAHHGILGQKWGVRRFQNYDGTLKAAGKQRKKESSDSEKTKDKKQFNKKKALVIAGSVAAVAAIGAIGYYAVKNNTLDKAVENGKNVASEFLVGSADKIEGAEQVREPLETTLKECNKLPKRAKIDSCFQTSLAVAMTRIFNIPMTAVADVDENGQGKPHLIDELYDIFKGQLTNEYGDPKRGQVFDMSRTDIANSSQAVKDKLIDSFGLNAAGLISTEVWSNNDKEYKGHIFDFEIKEGIVSFLDGIQPESVQNLLGEHYFDKNQKTGGKRLQAVRLDNLDISKIDNDRLHKFSNER